jgi:hypothetical protein
MSLAVDMWVLCGVRVDSPPSAASIADGDYRRRRLRPRAPVVHAPTGRLVAAAKLSVPVVTGA